MVEVVARLVLAGTLVAASVAKLAGPASSRAALATFGIEGGRTQAVAWALLIATELGLAAGVAARSDEAALLAAGLMAMFAATMVGAILRGKAGAPCACFGARSTVGWGAVARNALLTVAFAGLPFLPEGELSTDEWLALGLGVMLLLCLGLGIAVLALAREVGMLRLRLGPSSALEIPEEGPGLGSRTGVVDRFRPGPEATLALAVFASEECRVCRALEPAVNSLASDPLVVVETFEERRDAEVWEALGVPGSPYAIVLALDGTILAKGTFNNLAQLESVLAAAERRRAEGELAGAVGVG
jgi:hypothetical protein